MYNRYKCYENEKTRKSKLILGAQPGFWRRGGGGGRGPNLGVTLGRILENVMPFDALYFIYCTKIINLANFKVMFFSAFIRKKYLQR